MGRITRDLTVVEGLMLKWVELRHLQWVPRRALQVRYIALEMPKLEEVLPNFDGYMVKITQLLIMALVGGKQKAWKQQKPNVLLTQQDQKDTKAGEQTDELESLKMRQAEEEKRRREQDAKLAVVFALLERKGTQVALDVAVSKDNSVISSWKKELMGKGLTAGEADRLLDPILESLRTDATPGYMANVDDLVAPENNASLQAGGQGWTGQGLRRSVSAASSNDAHTKEPGATKAVRIFCVDQSDGGKL